MKKTQRPKKRVVSRGDYAREQGNRVMLVAVGVAILSFGAIPGLATAACIVRAVAHFKLFAAGYHLTQLISGLGNLVYGLGFGFWAAMFISAGLVIIAASFESKVVPVTRANTGELPALDSLVRASQETARAQESVLLRASEERRHEEQGGTLLRAFEDRQREEQGGTLRRAAPEEMVYVGNSH